MKFCPFLSVRFQLIFNLNCFIWLPTFLLVLWNCTEVIFRIKTKDRDITLQAVPFPQPAKSFSITQNLSSLHSEWQFSLNVTNLLPACFACQREMKSPLLVQIAFSCIFLSVQVTEGKKVFVSCAVIWWTVIFCHFYNTFLWNFSVL